MTRRAFGWAAAGVEVGLLAVGVATGRLWLVAVGLASAFLRAGAAAYLWRTLRWALGRTGRG